MLTKTCNRCSQEKPVEGFYRHPDMPDGRLNQCKECKKAYQRGYARSPAGRAVDKRKYERNKEAILARNAAYRERNKAAVLEAQRRWHEENREYVNAQAKRRYEENREEVIAKVAAYRQTERGRQVHAEALKAYRQRHPEKAKAHDAVKNAIRDGKLMRDACEICGTPDAEAHHDDYLEPLKVRWLCFKHHKETHGQVVVNW